MTSRKSHAWRVVAGLSFVSSVIYGATICTLGLFLTPIIHAFDSTSVQASRAATSFILAMTLVTPALGWLIERVGARSVMTIGAIITAAGYVLAARSETIDLYIVAMALAGAGVGASTYVPSTFVISSWIEEKRGLAM